MFDHNQTLNQTIFSKFNFLCISEEDLRTIINNLKNKTSTGPYDLSYKFIKTIAAPLITPFTQIINQSIFNGVYPDALKTAKVIPLFKKDDNEIMDNYRPVSCLCPLAQIIGKVVNTQLTKYMMENKLFFNSQHGFRKIHSTETAAIELVDYTKNEIDNGHCPVSIFIDLSKAFDTIDHSILLQKLKYYGIDGIALNWFKSYLNERKQFVVINDSNSDLNFIKTGVPQGSILGPLLFLIYINDLQFISTNLKLISFADDTTITLSLCFVKNACNYCNNEQKFTKSHLNQELQNVYNWLCANKLSLNLKKTKYMIFHNSQRNIAKNHLFKYLVDEPSTIKINETPIERVKSYKFLGLILQENLSWKEHIEKTANNISRTICILYKIKYKVPQNILKMIYSALILPHLNYGILIWGFDLERLFILQKKAIRIISNSFFLEHTDKLFKKLKLLKIHDIFKLKCAVFFYKFQKNDLPHQLMSILSYQSSNHQYYTRNSSNIPFDSPIETNNQQQNLEISRTNLKCSESCIRFFIPQFIPTLPADILSKINTVSLCNFKYQLKKYYIDLYSDDICSVSNCYPCIKKFFHPYGFSSIIRFLHLYSYMADFQIENKTTSS